MGGGESWTIGLYRAAYGLLLGLISILTAVELSAILTLHPLAAWGTNLSSSATPELSQTERERERERDDNITTN